MDFLKENWIFITFIISTASTLLGVFLSKSIENAQIKMQVKEIENDLIKLKEHQEADSKTINQLYTVLEKSISEQKLQFEFIQKTLVRLDK